MRDVMAKFRKGAKCKTSSGELVATTAPGSEAVVMEGVGVTSAGPVTVSGRSRRRTCANMQVGGTYVSYVPKMDVLISRFRLKQVR